MSGRARPGRLHVITDATRGRLDHLALARCAVEGGADTVQFREKRPHDTARLVAVARRLVAAVGEAATVIVNDRVDVALAAGIHAVHLGRDDMSPAEARRRLGARALIGRTANSLDEALAVDREPVDYLGVGPVFGTTSKAAPAPRLGLEGLAAIVAAVRRPVIAIGGIGPERIGAVLETGAHGVAVLSAVVDADDPRAAVAACAAAVAQAG